MDFGENGGGARQGRQRGPSRPERERGRIQIPAYRISNCIDKVAQFGGYTSRRFEILPGDIAERSLVVAIPDVGQVSAAQWQAMYNGYMYGVTQGVDVSYVTVTG